MAFATIDKKLYVLTAVAICTSVAACALATAAPGAVAASRWLSLPGLALPGWAPLAAALAAVALLRWKDVLALAFSCASLTVSVAMSLVCSAALL
ncbi:MAG: hypothetical protein PUD81_09105 [Eggerthellales bacterium]|nr:hypothetical protein [Eggerthellales bacterium]